MTATSLHELLIGRIDVRVDRRTRGGLVPVAAGRLHPYGRRRMSPVVGWAVEIGLLIALVAAAVAVDHLMPVPFWATGAALVGSVLAAHMVLHYTQEAAR